MLKIDSTQELDRGMMTSAVDQEGNGHLEGFNALERHGSECSIVVKTTSEGACASSIETGNEICKSEIIQKLEDKALMPHWMNSDQVLGKYLEGHSKVEATLDGGPCTPMPSLYRQKHESDETPGLLPSLSLGFCSSGSGVLDVAHGLEERGSSIFASQASSTPSGQVGARPSRLLTPLKVSTNHSRIQMEIQRESPDIHKENLLSLSLPKVETGPQCVHNFDYPVFSREMVGQPLRALAWLGGTQIPEDNSLHYQQFKSQQLPMCGNYSYAHSAAFVWTSPCMLRTNFMPIKQARADRRHINTSNSLTLLTSEARDGESKQLFEEERPVKLHHLSTDVISNCTSEELSPQVKPYLSEGVLCQSTDCPGSSNGKIWSAFTDNNVCVASTTNTSPPSLGEEVKCEQLSPVTQGDYLVQQHPMNDALASKGEYTSFGKRQKSSFPKEQQQCEKRFGFTYWKHCRAQLDNAQMYHREVKKPKMNRKGAVEHFNISFPTTEAGDTSAIWFDQQADDLPGECLQKQTKQNDITDDGESISHSTWQEMQMVGTTTIHTSTVTSRANHAYMQELQKRSGYLSLETKAESKIYTRSIENQYSEICRDDEANRMATGWKLFATHAHAQMPKALSTFSRGNPSLPLSLELSHKLPDSVGKRNRSLVNTSDGNWGKFLALFPTPEVNKGLQTPEVDAVLPYQQRFIQLQAFLKQCDESDQKVQLQELRYLSPAARSGHAVELESRAIRLSLEEVKEMNRMRLLKVLGRNTDRMPTI